MPDALRCHGCGAAWTGGRPEFRATCGRCGRWIHCCLHCRHYDPGAHHQCRASATAEFVGDKEKFNYCEEFSPRAGGGSSTPPGAGRDALERLFGGG